MLTDFSLAEHIGVRVPSSDMYCTVNYRPPEFLRRSKVDAKDLLCAADLWSFGCTVWEIASRHHCGEQQKAQLLFPGCAAGDVRNAVAAYTAYRQKAAEPALSPWGIRVAKAGPWATMVATLCNINAGSRVYRPLNPA